MGTVAVDSTLALTNSKQRRSAPNCSNASFIKIQLKVKLYTVEDGERSVLGTPSKCSRNPKYTGMVLNTNLLMGYSLHDTVPEPFNYV